MDEIHIRKWVCVNTPVTPVDRQEIVVATVAQVAEQSSQSVAASKYRDAILKSASRINDFQMQQSKKHKVEPGEQAEPESKKRITKSYVKPRARRSAQTEVSKKKSLRQRLPLGSKDPNIKLVPAATKQSTAGQHDSLCIPARKLAATQDVAKTNLPCVPKSGSVKACTVQSQYKVSKTKLASSGQIQFYDDFDPDIPEAQQDMQDQPLEDATPKLSKSATTAQKKWRPSESDSDHAQDLDSAAIKRASPDTTISSSPPVFDTKDIREPVAGVEDIGADIVSGIPTHFALPSPSRLASGTSIRPFLRKTQHNRTVPNEYCPIPRMLPGLRILTCFRIAEVSRLLKESNFMIELYAIATPLHVLPSNRSQSYRLADLFFPDRPPYLTGTYVPFTKKVVEPSTRETSTKSIEVNREQSSSNDLDATSPSSLSLTEKMLVRAMIQPLPVKLGTPPPKKYSNPRQPYTLSNQAGVIAHIRIEAIWESDWDEVEHVRGIVDPDDAEANR